MKGEVYFKKLFFKKIQKFSPIPVDSFLASLDPRQWLDGLNTPAELFTCTLELVLCLAFLLSSILFFTKCVIPLCRCVHFVAKPSKKK